MANVAHAMSKNRNRNHVPLISQLRTLDRNPPLKFKVPFSSQRVCTMSSS
jgi:hypothetical protein